MRDDHDRVYAALKNGLDAEAAVRSAWSEAETACPAAILLPARSVPVCAAAEGTLLTEIVQTVRLTAKSCAQLRRLVGQAEDAMLALGYRLTDMRTEEGRPRMTRLQFTGIADEERMYCQYK